MDNIIEIPEEITPPEEIIPGTPEPYSVYVQTDEQGHITAVNSSAFVDAEWGAEIDQGYGDKYHHAQGNYFDQIYTDDGIPRYKLEDGKPVERTEEEIEADRAALPEPGPTENEKLRRELELMKEKTIKERIYDHVHVSVRTMDIFIGVMVVLFVVVVVMGMLNK